MNLLNKSNTQKIYFTTEDYERLIALAENISEKVISIRKSIYSSILISVLLLFISSLLLFIDFKWEWIETSKRIIVFSLILLYTLFTVTFISSKLKKWRIEQSILTELFDAIHEYKKFWDSGDEGIFMYTMDMRLKRLDFFPTSSLTKMLFSVARVLHL